MASINRATVGKCNESIRIRVIRPNRKPVYVYPGLKDNVNNRIVASRIAFQIESDLNNNCFDSSHKRYKVNNYQTLMQDISLKSLILKYIEFLATRNKSETIRQFTYWIKDIPENIALKKAIKINRDDVKYYVSIIKNNIQVRYAQRKLSLISNAYFWGYAEGLLNEKVNPFEHSGTLLGVGDSRTSVEYFTKHEAEQIIEYFVGTVYYNYVKFIFHTGLRLGEANGLTKDCVSSCQNFLTIKQQYVNGRFYEHTKTHKDRTFKLTENTKTIILEQLENTPYLFLNESNEPIDTKAFRKNVWVKALTELNIRYRKPYAMRATFITELVRKGIKRESIAAITGHSLTTMDKYYIGLEDSPTLPEF